MAAGGAILSSSASSQILPGVVYAPTNAGPDPLAPLAATPQLTVPTGINPQLLERAKAALNSHQVWPRDTIGVVDFSLPSSDPRFHVVDLQNGKSTATVSLTAAAPIPIIRDSSSVSRTISARTRVPTGPTSRAIIMTASMAFR